MNFLTDPEPSVPEDFSIDDKSDRSHFCIVKWSVLYAVGKNLNAVDSLEHFQSQLLHMGGDVKRDDPKQLVDLAKRILGEDCGKYGITHSEISEWLKNNEEALILISQQYIA